MVLKKSLEYGFYGFHFPIVPRAPRSNRRRGPRKIAMEDHQICAFELLATLAGKLLQENESSTSSNASEAKDLLGVHTIQTNNQTVVVHNKALTSECVDHESCIEESVFVPESTAMKHNKNNNLLPDSRLEQIMNNISSDSCKKVVDCELKLGISNSNLAEGDLIPLFPSVESDHINQSKDLTMVNTLGAKKPVNPDSNVQLSNLYRDPFPPNGDVNLGIRDNDENSFRCNKFSTKIRAFKPQPRNSSYGRTRKMYTSKYWKTTPKFRDHDLSNTDEGVKMLYRNRKRFDTQDRYIKEAPFKKRMLYDHSFEVDYDQEETSNESICNTFEKGIKGDRGNQVSNSVKAHKKQKDSKVKLSIKSFKVPELYLEVPETETIGSLKRTVMETVTTILGGGLRVGLVVQGKKIRDDNRTLQQAGIYSSNLDTSAFILEPSFTPIAETCKDSTHMFNKEQKSQRSPVNTNLDSSFAQVRKMDVVTSYLVHDNPSTDETKQDLKALVLIPTPKVEPLAMVPMNPKPKRTELSQRRARRPFSVVEVEALVEAVETLGTGRWRDVKMRAFDNVDHRTYVDLKDKWKTLVHTASISSQQRRGEPVPQVLLDRVLSAHAYWSEHQSKPHGKAVDAQSKSVEV